MALFRLTGVEEFKLRRRLLTWILLAVLLGMIVIVYVLYWSATESLAEGGDRTAIGDIEIGDVGRLRETLYLQQAVPFGLQLTQILGTFLAVILVAGSVGSEYGWNTIRPYLTMVPSRREYIAGKFLALAGYILAGTFLGMITALLSSSVITEVAGRGDYSFIDAGYVGESLLSYGRTLLAMAPYVAMALFFAVWGRSTIAGIGASLGILFLEAVITNLLQLSGETTARLANVFPGANADTLMLENGLQAALRMQETGPLADVPRLDPLLASLVLLGYFAAFVIATFVLFERRDVRA